MKAGTGASACTWISQERKLETAQASVSPWRVNHTWSSRTMEFHFVVKKNEALTQATTWINLENPMPCEESQTRAVTYCMTPFV